MSRKWYAENCSVDSDLFSFQKPDIFQKFYKCIILKKKNDCSPISMFHLELEVFSYKN